MSHNLIFAIAEANAPQKVGGKAYALYKMVQAGFTVPGGFVVSADAFRAMTPALRQQLLERFDELGADAVAVRSSAINEDSADATWAGQLDTFLNCRRDELVARIEACWDSAQSARALAYASQKALPSTKVAVVIQKMIQSEVSGVAFSVHPISHNAKQVVIEAGFGLGEAIVSGEITPDTYVVDKTSGQCIETHIAHQHKELVRDAAGKTVWHTLGQQGGQQKLSDSLIAEVCALTAKLETFFAAPVDVEWAVSNGRVYMLQSRPITTLAPGKDSL